jgi:uncharacterized protein
MRSSRLWMIACLLVACANATPADTTASAAPPGSGSAEAPKGEAPPKLPAPGAPEQLALAKDVVRWLVEGKHEKVRALFDEAMNEALPSERAVGKTWGAVEAQFGALEKQVGAVSQKQDPYTVVLVTCVFEKSPMDVRLVFDAEGRLAGFQVVATTNPEAYGERPQTPKPPFPYGEREVLYDNAAAKTKIGGTLTVPPGGGPHPAVLLITGSGSQDRDETLFGHKPFLVIADHLTRKGFAVLRVDDRGMGTSTGDPATSTVDDHASDVAASVAFLKRQAEIDPKRIGLVGHSEGGVLAAMVAARSSDVAFVVSLAGPAVSGAELNPMQVEALLRAQGVAGPIVAEIVAGQKKLMHLLVTDAPEDELRAAVKELAKAGAKATPGANPDDVETQKAVGSELVRLLSPWFRSWAKADTPAYLAKVRVPILIMIGDKDLQVPADENLAKARAALATNPRAQFEKLAGLNHLFQTANTGSMEEYLTIAETISPTALVRMSAWLLEQAK